MAHRRWLLPLLALALAACVEDGGGDDDDANVPRPDASMIDSGPVPDMDRADSAPEPEPEPEPPLPVESCADACGRIAACDRLDIFGDYDACLTACDRASRRAPPEAWFDCLEFERNCGLIQICRLPEPPPLTCDEVCTAVDGCGVAVPFPNCVGECGARNGNDAANPRFALCGEDLVGDVCDGAGFWQCLGDTVYTACAARCDVSIACNLERAEGCLQACVGEAFAEDPLARLRGSQRTQCIGRVGGDCQRADACLNPQPGPAVVDRATFCAAWDQCGAQIGLPCDEFWQIGQDQPGFAECVVEQVRNGCPPDPFLIFEVCFDNPVGQLGPGCPELCEARGTCDQLPEGEDQLGCLRRCGEAIQGRDDEASQRQRALFPCGIAGTCDELAECLVDNSPADACAAHCGALDGCGLAGDDCLAECDALYFRGRQAAFRGCVADADGDCAAMAGCDPGEPIGCDVRCARLRACGNAQPGCEASCDDASFADPARAARETACVLDARLCFEGLAPVSNCAGNPDVAGRACLGFCRARTGCDPAAVGPLVDCLVECGEGFVGDDGLRLFEARDCLEAANVNGACAPLERCIPAVAPVDCPGWCAPLDACEAAPAGCEAACPEDPLSQLRTLEQVQCLGLADGCEEVEQCYLGEVVDVPDPVDPVALCARYRACGLEDFFPCEFLLEEFGGDPATLQCVQNAIAVCPPDPFIIFDLCFNGGPVEPETFGPCAELCEARGRCGALGGSIRDCTVTCTEAARRAPNGPQAALLVCKDALDCPALAECTRANGPAARCADVCATAIDCGAFPDEGACLVRCEAVLLGAFVPATYLDDVGACLGAFADDPARCAAEGAACFDVQLGDCGAACDALLECGFAEGDPQECVQGCQQDPEAQPIVQCILQHLAPPNRCDIESFEQCAGMGIDVPPDRGEPAPDPDEPPLPER